MNDICSPMVILLDDEADAFWCFERAMRRLVFLLSILCIAPPLLSVLVFLAIILSIVRSFR